MKSFIRPTLYLTIFAFFTGIVSTQESQANPLSKTSSATGEGIRFPENSGTLNVAPTPEGKADTGTRVNIPEEGQPSEWRKKATPPDELQSAQSTASQFTKVKVGGY
ncbi:MAG: hypothetical protein VYC39_18280, partial [Myxococcota bacterium]|nr:hypothetical protein [Myxococcota bacterium]